MNFPTSLSDWPSHYDELRLLVRLEFGDDISWSQNVKAPTDADDFALECIYVILNSGMKWKVCQGIWQRLRPHIEEHGCVGETFRHPGKRSAMDKIWERRTAYFTEFRAAAHKGDAAALEWCGTLPWIGPITKYHLAKNFGVDCAKPDRHLVRAAEAAGTDTHTLCKIISDQSGDRVATVDYVIWRACEMGILTAN
ncbi:hypothetical protein NKJ09_23380 [Mesorhizobium sp. M0189]|uniref:hypothetical protein n=1 Tax=Mesorhizobium sp. M0189 TaxID=2956909 RepID=UPI003336CC6C